MNFWKVHGIFFLIFITFFPRLTMLFAVTAPFGFLAWIGWLFFPYLTVAILATNYYWHTNPILCIIAWFVALAGTGGEIQMARTTRTPYMNDHLSETNSLYEVPHDPQLSTQRLTEHYENFSISQEICNAYSKLNDPQTQINLNVKE